MARSACPLDCPDHCSLEVTVEGDRVQSINGSRLNPVTQGFICAKVRGYAQRIDAPERLLHPGKRVGRKGEGRFVQVSWDEALDTVAERLREVRRSDGGEAILPYSYGGSNGLLSQGIADEGVFRAMGASRLDRTVCAAQTGAVAQAIYGKMPSIDFPDFAEARLIILWGANPKATHVHLMPFLKKAREKGTRVVLVDPRLTLPASFVDMHLPVLPGSDGAVALAMIAHLERIGAVDHAFLRASTEGWERLLTEARAWDLERAAARSGIPASQIASLAESYAEAEPAVVRCGWGVERNRNGEAAVAAILALPAVAGKFGKPGGGYALSSSEAFAVDYDRLAGAPEPQTRHINMSQLGRALLETRNPKIQALFVYDANPAVTVPDQGKVIAGLTREDLFTVVFDQVMTDTAAYADILLPATTFLEHREVSISYGGYAVLYADPVVPPRGEARSNENVFAELAARLGIAVRGPKERLEDAVHSLGGPLAGDVSVERLQREGVFHFDFPGARPVQFGTVFPPDKRVHFYPADLGPEPYAVQEDPASATYPLALISPATDKTICTILGESVKEKAWAEMNPVDARARGLEGGGKVSIHNALGEVVVRLRLNPELRPGVVFLPKGIWNRHTDNGRVGTTLVPDDVSPICGGALFNDARVDVRPAP